MKMHHLNEYPLRSYASIHGCSVRTETMFHPYCDNMRTLMGRWRIFILKIEGKQLDELKQIISILANRINNTTDELTKTTVRRLAETYIGIVAESVRGIGLQQLRMSQWIHAAAWRVGLPLAFPIFHSETSAFFIHSLSEEYMYKNKPLDWLSHFSQHK